MRRRFLFSILIISLFLLFLAASGWTLMISLSTEDLTQEAENIIVGKVVKKECRYDEEGKRIYTYVTISVEEDLKGKTGGKEITVRHLGGEVGEIGLWVEDTPSFEEDEEVLLFLKKGKKPEVREIVGRAQGKFRVKRDEFSGERMVVSKEKEVYEKGCGIVREERKTISLVDFKKEIKEIMRKHGKR